LEPDKVLALDDVLVLAALLREPPLAVAQAVLGVWPHRRRDVRGQRPRRRRPDHERLVAVAQREADIERRVLELGVVLVARLLVLRERGPAARAPLRRPMALVEP